MAGKTRVLILCTGNSARSQIAEGYLKHKAGDRFEVYSAGSNPAGYVHSCATAAMREIGIDISAHRSKHLRSFIDQEFDYVITVCDNANEECPVFPGKSQQRIHRNFSDPAAAPEDIIAQRFRETRDAITAWLDDLFKLG